MDCIVARAQLRPLLKCGNLVTDGFGGPQERETAERRPDLKDLQGSGVHQKHVIWRSTGPQAFRKPRCTAMQINPILSHNKSCHDIIDTPSSIAANTMQVPHAVPQCPMPPQMYFQDPWKMLETIVQCCLNNALSVGLTQIRGAGNSMEPLLHPTLPAPERGIRERPLGGVFVQRTTRAPLLGFCPGFNLKLPLPERIPKAHQKIPTLSTKSTPKPTLQAHSTAPNLPC